jgi:hypothetical protein
VRIARPGLRSWLAHYRGQKSGQGGREAGHVVLPRHQPQHHDQDDGHGRGQRLAYDDVVAFALDNATT